MLMFLGHRIADRRLLGLICKWLQAGVMEDGRRVAATKGSPQGAVISPLLAKIYLHYVLDLWARQWRQRHARGEMIVVRYAPTEIQRKALAWRIFGWGIHSGSLGQNYISANIQFSRRHGGRRNSRKITSHRPSTGIGNRAIATWQ
ncbi:MAG: hypothetical protein ACOH2R_23460 [Pseudomonas sp.]